MAPAQAAIVSASLSLTGPGTTASVDSFTGSTVDLSVSTADFSTTSSDLLSLVGFTLGMMTDGTGGSVTFTETITNTGTTAWHEWFQISSGIPDLFASPITFAAPDAVTWSASATASVAGTFSVVELPEFGGQPEGTFTSGVFFFDTPLLPGESFTLEKTLIYGDGIDRLVLVSAPAALPLPASVWFLLFATAGLGLLARRRTS